MFIIDINDLGYLLCVVEGGEGLQAAFRNPTECGTIIVEQAVRRVLQTLTYFIKVLSLSSLQLASNITVLLGINFESNALYFYLLIMLDTNESLVLFSIQFSIVWKNFSSTRSQK